MTAYKDTTEDQNVKGHVTLTTPLSAVICNARTRSRTCYDQPACQTWSLYLHQLQRY